MIIFNIEKNPYDIDKNLYAKNKCIFEEGVTVLIGKNGIGKSTMLHEIKVFCEKNNIKCYSYDNYKEGGQNAHNTYGFKKDFKSLARTLFHSEGEQIFYNLGQQMGIIGDFIKTNKNEKQLVILLDALDSGLDCEGFSQINDVFKTIQKDFGRELYIILSANNYGLVDSHKCFDTKNCKYVEIKSYEDYKNFILSQYEIERNNNKKSREN